MLNLGKSSEVEALKQLFETHYDMLCRIAFHYMQDKEEAEDIVQDFFYTIWESKRLSSIQKEFTHYAKVSIRNRCLTLLKKRSKTIYCTLPDELLDESDDIESRTEFEQQLDKLSSNLQLLPERQREILQMNVFGEMKYKEISERLNLSINTIKTHIKLAYKKLRSS